MNAFRGKGALALGGSLILVYLLVKNPSGLKAGITSASAGTVGVVKAFQGR